MAAQNWNEVSPRFETQRSAHYRSTVIDTLKWFCSELESNQIASALEDLFSEAPLCKLIKLGLNSTAKGSAQQRPEIDICDAAVECSETSFYSETSTEPCTLVQLEVSGQSADGAPWDAMLQLAVSAESQDVWQTILRSIGTTSLRDQRPSNGTHVEPLTRDFESEWRDEAVISCETAAHELVHLLRNPLGSIMTASGLLADGDDSVKSQENSQLLDIIQSQSSRIDTILSNHVRACEMPIVKWSQVNVEDVLKESTLKLSNDQAAGNTRITFSPQEDSSEATLIASDRALLEKLLSFLLRDVLAGLRGCGSITATSRRNADSVSIHLVYSGKELRPEILRKVVLPFASTKEGGSGLDSPPIHGIVCALRAEMSVASSGSGTRLTVSLPVNSIANRNNKCER